MKGAAMRTIYSDSYVELFPTTIVVTLLGAIFLYAFIYCLILHPIRGLDVCGHIIQYKNWSVLQKLICQIIPSFFIGALACWFLMTGITMLNYSYNMAHGNYNTAEGIIEVESYDEVMKKGFEDYKYKCTFKIGGDITISPSNDFEKDILDLLCSAPYGKVCYYKYWTGEISIEKIEIAE